MLPRMDQNLLIFVALQGYAVLAALLVLAVLYVRRRHEPSE